MKLIDLHIHTRASDGTLSPEDTVAYAAKRHLAAIAITDHDTAHGAALGVKFSEKYGVEVVPGIEISAEYRGYGIHILGYFIDPAAPSLGRVLDWINTDRERRNSEIAELMRRDGLYVTLEGLRARYPETDAIGRPHFAACLVEHGLAASVREGFDRYLNRGCRYYRARRFLPLGEAFAAISGAGGKAVFAHPLQYRMDDAALTELTRRLTDCGAVGMECLYSGYTADESAYLEGLARRFGLCVTGGSDFHGFRKPDIDMGTGTGDLRVPYELLEILRAR